MLGKDAEVDKQRFQEKVRESSQSISEILSETEKVIVGQKHMLEGMIKAFLCNGHVLLEGLPGLAKTLAIRTLAEVLELEFNRIQFTPDLLPSDLIGSMIYNQSTNEFSPKKGPIFANIILADEINRSPAKVQSALLEAMAEGQVTIGDNTFILKKPFIVLATQNPIEQEGTYALPEAQLDRFLFKIKVSYPSRKEEKLILDRICGLEQPKTRKKFSVSVLEEAKTVANKIYVDEKMTEYILNIIFASRYPEQLKLHDLKSYIQVGGSPRATIGVFQGAKASAFLEGRSFVIPDDVKSACYDALRHRLLITYDAESNNLTSEHIIRKILDEVEVP